MSTLPTPATTQPDTTGDSSARLTTLDLFKQEFETIQDMSTLTDNAVALVAKDLADYKSGVPVEVIDELFKLSIREHPVFTVFTHWDVISPLSKLVIKNKGIDLSISEEDYFV